MLKRNKRKILDLFLWTILLFAISYVIFFIINSSAIQSKKINWLLIEYYINPIIGMMFVPLYYIVKIGYDLIFNKIKNATDEKKYKIILWIIYVIFMLVFSLFSMYGTSNFTIFNTYTFQDKFLSTVYLLSLSCILPFWNILYNLIEYLLKRKKTKISESK